MENEVLTATMESLEKAYYFGDERCCDEDGVFSYEMAEEYAIYMLEEGLAIIDGKTIELPEDWDKFYSLENMMLLTNHKYANGNHSLTKKEFNKVKRLFLDCFEDANSFEFDNYWIGLLYEYDWIGGLLDKEGCTRFNSKWFMESIA